MLFIRGKTGWHRRDGESRRVDLGRNHCGHVGVDGQQFLGCLQDRKSTRLNSSHLVISYAVFCLKKKKETWLVCKLSFGPAFVAKRVYAARQRGSAITGALNGALR